MLPQNYNLNYYPNGSSSFWDSDYPNAVCMYSCVAVLHRNNVVHMIWTMISSYSLSFNFSKVNWPTLWSDSGELWQGYSSGRKSATASLFSHSHEGDDV